MNVNAHRQIVSGIGGVGVYTGIYQQDGPVAMTQIQPPNAGNGPCWWGIRVMLNAASGQLSSCLPDGTDLRSVDPLTPRGATSYGAGDGWWAAYLADNQVTGVYSNWGLSLPHHVLCGAGPELYVTPHDGSGIDVYAPSGTTPEWSVPDAHPLEFYAVPGQYRALLWTEGDRRIRTFGLPPVAQVEAAYSPSAFFSNGRWWLCSGRQDGGAVIRPFDDPQHGFIIVPTGQDAFGPCVSVAIDSFQVVAFWGLNAGETAIAAKTIDLSGAMVDLFPPAPVIVFPPISDFKGPKSIAPFKCLGAETGADSEVVIDGAKATKSSWVGFDLDGGTASIDDAHARGLLIGIAAEGFGARGYDAARPKADALRTRVAWWSDGLALVTPPAGLNTWDQVWTEFYRYIEHGETLEQSVTRWRRAFDLAYASHCVDLGGIPEFFTRGLLSDQDTVDVIGAAFDAFEMADRLKVWALFEYQRLNGITGNAAVREMYGRTLRASVHGVPTFVPQWPTPPHPTPTPTPTPQPEPTPMPTQIAFSQKPLGVEIQPSFDQIVTVTPHPDGHGLSALDYGGSQFASWSGADWDAHKPSAGAWERFQVNPGTLTAYRDGKVTVFPCQPVVVL